MGRKVCPWRYLQYYDLENINRGVTKHREMGVVVSRMINEIFKSDELRAKYVSETGQRNVNVLTDLFEEASKIFITPKRKERFGQLSWETFVKEARKMKLDNYKPDKKRRLPDNESTLLATNPEAFATPTREPRQQPQQPQQLQQLQQEVEMITVQQPIQEVNIAAIVSPPPPSPPTTRAKSVLKSTAPTTRASKKKTAATTKKSTPSSTSKAKPPTTRKRRSYKSTASKKSSSQSTNTFESTFQPKQIVLKRNHCGQFESSPCSFCDSMNPIPTSHRCGLLQKGGMIDGDKEICGKAFCGPCGSSWGCEGSPYYCKLHAIPNMYEYD